MKTMTHNNQNLVLDNSELQDFTALLLLDKAAKFSPKPCQLDFNHGDFQFNGLVMYDYTITFNMRLTLWNLLQRFLV